MFEKKEKNYYEEYIQLRKELDVLYSTKLWRIGSKYYKIKDKLLGNVKMASQFEIEEILIKKEKLESKQESNQESKPSFLDYYNDKKKYLENYLLINEFGVAENELIEFLKTKKYKGIIIYPDAIKLNPKQRPQHLLKEFSKDGFLSIFIEGSSGKFKIQEISKNFIVINKEEVLLKVLQQDFVILYCTWLGQSPMIDLFPNKFVYYDVVDEIDFFSLYDKNYLSKHNQYLNSADEITYTAERLKKWVNKKAIFLPNGSHPEDFESIDKKCPKDIIKIIKNGNKNVGYFGAIEEWFDYDAINYVAKNLKNINFLIIGECKNKDLFNQKNIYLLGSKKYEELKEYSKFFDIGIIPFIKKELTDSVSPIKLYEYFSSEIPVISSDLYEVRKIKEVGTYGLELYKNKDEFLKLLNEVLKKKYDKDKLRKFALNNSWEIRFKKLKNNFEKNESFLKVFANISRNNVIAIKAFTFLDYEGKNFYGGGAERYLIDLYQLAKKNNIKVQIYQAGNFSWMRKFKDVEVISLGLKKELDCSVYSEENIVELSRNFYNYLYNQSKLNIYSAFFEAWPKALNPSIGISHGVAWDGKYNNYKNGYEFWNANYKLIDSFEMCNKIISVDTNTANWMQTINYNCASNMEVIPNYVDLEEFKPREDYLQIKEQDTITLIYARRIYEARGIYLLLDIVDELMELYSNLKIKIVGRGFEEDTKYVVEKCKKYGERFVWEFYNPEDMNKVYKDSDISLIPTLYSEGTSLSCIESMASGNAVIATRVGGLTDLVIDKFNGRLISPTKEALKEAIIEMVEDKEKLIAYKKNSFELSKVFNKKNWEEKWLKEIKNITSNSNPETKVVLIKGDYKKIFEKIYNMLLEGKLIYILDKNGSKVKNSYGRLQWISGIEELEEDIDEIINI